MKRREAQGALIVLGGPLLAFIVLLTSRVAPVRADTVMRYVAPAPDGCDAGNACTDPNRPCATIQHALEVAEEDDRIRVAGGVFTTQAHNVALISRGVSIQGGFSPDFST